MGAFVGQCQLWEGAACDVQFYPAAAVRFPSQSLKIMRTRPGKDKSPPSGPSLPSVFQLHVSFKLRTHRGSRPRPTDTTELALKQTIAEKSQLEATTTHFFPDECLNYITILALALASQTEPIHKDEAILSAYKIQ